MVVPGINDTEEDIKKLRELISPYTCVSKTELLPFRTLCLEKYENMGIEFPLKGTEQMDKERLQKLAELI